MSKLEPIELEYVYVTIPAEYICVYHRILAMLADYGIEMLKDCKANCTDRNENVIECFNMFNSAVACHKLGKNKEAETIIKYIKAKINQIYKGVDNSTSFVFPVDENGQIKAFVSCGERPRFEIDPDTMELYKHKFDNGFDEHFRLGIEDESSDDNDDDLPGTVPPNDLEDIQDIKQETKLQIELYPTYELIDDEYRPCADIIAFYDNKLIDINDSICEYYFDDKRIKRFNDVCNLSTGEHEFKVVVTYNNETIIAKESLYYAATN